MIDKSSEIFTRILSAVQPLCGSVSQAYQDSPAGFPHVFVDDKDNPVTCTDMENNECAVTLLIEVTAYTEGDLSLAKEIIGLADAEMQRMGFARLFGPQQAANIPDTGVVRVTARYSRMIADGDEL